MKYLLFLTIGLMVLAGCDVATKAANQYIQDNKETQGVTLVFGENFEVLIDGKPVSVIGFDTCPPKSNLNIFFGDVVSTNEKCIVINKDTEAVSVMLFLPAGHVTEQWKVTHVNGNQRVSLIRPNGDYVVSANNRNNNK